MKIGYGLVQTGEKVLGSLCASRPGRSGVRVNRGRSWNTEEQSGHLLER